MKTIKQTLRVKITSQGTGSGVCRVIAQAPWFASAAQTQATPAACVAALNARAARQGLGVSYALATEAEYQAYKATTRA